MVDDRLIIILKKYKYKIYSQVTWLAFFTWQIPSFSNFRAPRVFGALAEQLIRFGFSKDSSNINPSVWTRLTLSAYGQLLRIQFSGLRKLKMGQCEGIHL